MDAQFEPTNPLSMPFECFTYEPGNKPFPVAEHWHYFAELVLCREGKLLIRRNGEDFFLTPGEILFINPLVCHSLDTADGDPVKYGVIKLDLNQFEETPCYAPDLRSMMLEAERNQLPMHLSAKEVHESHMDFMVSECIHEYRTRAYAYDLKIRAMLYLITTSLVRLWIGQGVTLQVRPVPSDPLYTVTSYIDHHIGESLKVEDLAKYCGLSYPWFAKRFRDIYGISCKEYIEKVRISRVEHFLLFTDRDLNDISRETGYADCSHMIKDFRRLKGTTPGQFRQQQRKT